MIMELIDICFDFFFVLYISFFYEWENILLFEIYDKLFGLVLIYYFFRCLLIVGIL